MAKGSGTKTDRLTSAARKQRGSHWTGQDTVLALLFDALQPTNRYFVEFGFNTNSYAPGQNTEKIWHAGWRGLLLDGGHANASINLQQEFIKSTNIVELFRKHGVPLEPDYVSVDMDSADLWVVDAMLGTYKPRVYSVEYNPNYPWRFAYDLPGRGAVGPRVQARPRTLWTQRRGQAVKSRLLRRRLGTSNGPRRKEARLHSCGGRQAVGHVLRAGRCVMALATRPCASLELVDDVNVSFSPSGNEVKNAFAKGWAVNTHPDYKQMTAEQAVTMIDYEEFLRQRDTLGRPLTAAVAAGRRAALQGLFELGSSRHVSLLFRLACFAKLKGNLFVAGPGGTPKWMTSAAESAWSYTA